MCPRLQACPVTLGVAAFVWSGVQLVGNFWLFWLVYYITLAVGVAIAYFIAAIAPTMVRGGGVRGRGGVHECACGGGGRGPGGGGVQGRRREGGWRGVGVGAGHVVTGA